MMTYFGFLLCFLIAPLAILMTWMWRNQRQHAPPWGVLLATSFIALVYTTPWDNYLVANRIWSYATNLVSGLIFGWVPVEEYLFFVLQPLLIGSWLVVLTRWLPQKETFVPSLGTRRAAVGLFAILWLCGVVLLFSGWSHARYLSLELVWALPPLALQLAFGADILWRDRRRLGLAIVSSTVYLCVADALAIASGTWTINPAFSLDYRFAGVLPVEECLFFLLTSTLIVFTIGLICSPHATERKAKILAAFSRRVKPLGVNRDRKAG